MNLLHPIPVYIQQIDKEGTSRMDVNLRAPIGAVNRTPEPIKLYGQIKWYSKDNQLSTEPGNESRSSGYILFRDADLREQHLTLNIGDRVTQIGTLDYARDVDLYFIKFEPIAHRGLGSGGTKAHFQDRQPLQYRVG